MRKNSLEYIQERDQIIKNLSWYMNMYSKNLKELRADDELTQKELATYLGISDSKYSKYESEYSIMPLKHLNKLCEYFNVSMDYMFDLTIKKRYEESGAIKDKEEIGKRLREARELINISQEKMAKKIGTTQSVISGYEAGKFLISTTSLHNICKTYKISADWLLGRIDNPKFR